MTRDIVLIQPARPKQVGKGPFGTDIAGIPALYRCRTCAAVLFEREVADHECDPAMAAVVKA